MTLLIIAIIIILIIYAASANKKPYEQNVPNSSITSEKSVKNTLTDDFVDGFFKNMETPIQNSIILSSLNDDSVIDVTDHSYTINSKGNLIKYFTEVPFWAHQYVYSYSELNSTSNEQKEFYNFFKNSFLNEEYLDLEGNTNYAFILLFDLLIEFDSHKDITKLECQLKVLGQYYPKTKSYAMSFLIRKMESIGDNDAVPRLAIDDRSRYYNYETDYDYWKLGRKYKEKLNLNEEEVKLLNKLWFSSNNFCNIEYCLFEILKLYISLFAELKEIYIQEGTTLDVQFLSVADVLARKHFKYKEGSQNYKYCIETVTNEFYSYIFKYCENAVREFYGHKRKLNTDNYYTNEEAKTEFETKINSRVSNLLVVLIHKVAMPDEITDIELYSQNTNRWRIKFGELTAKYNDKPKEFVDSIAELGKLNKKNPSIENIFFEGSKFMAKYDKESAISLYVHYLFHDLKSATFDNKQLTKTIQKNLFKTNEQFHDFEVIVNELIKDKDLEKALNNVSKVYEVKRKKIRLDTASIKEVQQQHSGTVKLLNEYLKDDFVDDNSSIELQEIMSEEIQINIIETNSDIIHSAFVKDLNFSPIQLSTLELFSKSSFSVLQIELEDFSKTKGIFKNQLIESINETCYDFLDDVLIEEEDEFYTINTNYFQRISVQ